MSDTVDPNSNITTKFKQTPTPSLSIRDVSQPDRAETERVRNSIEQGTNAKKPNLTKKRIKKPNRR